MKVAAQKGITLIVLVVTIAILLILAGVTIYSAFNKDGLIDSTKEFKNIVENTQDGTAQKINNLLENLEGEIIGDGSTIQDETGPTVIITKEAVGTNFIEVTVSATDAQSGMPTNPEYKYYIKPTSTTTWPTTASYSGTNTNYTFTELTQNTSYDIKVTTQDIAGNTGEKILTEIKTTSTIIIDLTNPTASISLSANSTEIEQEITATVTHTDNESGVDTTSCKYIYNTTSSNIGTTSTAWNSATAFSSNTQTISLTATTEGTYYLHVLTVDKAGNKTETVSEAVTVVDTGIKAPEIANATDKSEYYGKTVFGYTCTNNVGVSAWKIYYADNNNIYLIADDYIHYDYCPGSANKKIYKNAEYRLSMDYVISDYSTGSASISNTTIQNLNKNYFDYLTTNSTSSTNNNMKAIAYMLDTNVWSVYKDSTNADYAIGGPTVELLFASYNQTHSTNYQTRVQSTTGYQISNDGGTNWANNYTGMISTSDTTYEDLYISSSTTKAKGVWLTSPSAGSTSNVMYIYYNGQITGASYSSTNPGIRPVVCLKTDVELEKLPDGNFKIKGSILTGDIIANGITWSSGTATVSLGATTSGIIQYKVGSSGTWTTGTKVTGRKHGDVIYARLTDGTNYTSESTINVLDGINPTASISLSANSTEIGQEITATVTHTDSQSGVNTSSCKYIYNTTATKIGTTSTIWNSATAFSSNSQTISLTATTEETYYLHVLTVDKAGNKTETVSKAVTVEASKPRIEELIGKVTTDNETVYDKYGNKIRVPEGFKILSHGTRKWKSYSRIYI